MATGSPPKRAPRVLVVSQFYEPSTGGGLSADARATVAALAAHAEVRVLTGDREVGEDRPMAVAVDRWVPHPGREAEQHEPGPAPPQVKYVRLGTLPLRKVRRAVLEADPDVIVLFSTWSPASMAMVVLRRLGMLGRGRRLVLAPCGELFPGALAKKGPKKRAVLGLGRRAALWRGVRWRATDDAERQAIADAFPAGEVCVAPVLSAPSFAVERVHDRPDRGRIHLVTVALVVPNKGLAFAIDRIGELAAKGTVVHLDAFGAQVDAAYLATCREAIGRLPATATVTLHGVASHDAIAEALARADVFILPTQFENFCYAILEALDAGCPVLTSDRTPWRDLAADRAGWDVPLEDAPRWVDALLEAAGWDDAERDRWATGSRARAAAARAEITTRGTAAWLDLVGLDA